MQRHAVRFRFRSNCVSGSPFNAGCSSDLAPRPGRHWRGMVRRRATAATAAALGTLSCQVPHGARVSDRTNHSAFMAVITSNAATNCRYDSSFLQRRHSHRSAHRVSCQVALRCGDLPRPVTVNMGMSMPSWFDINSLDPRLFRRNPPGLAQSAEFVRQLIKETTAASNYANAV